MEINFAMSFKNTKHLQNIYLASVPEPKIVSDIISGSVNEASNSDKSIWVYDRITGELLASTMVDRDTRNWSIAIDPERPNESLLVVCRDEGGEYNADVFDRVSLCSREVEVSGISNVLDWGAKDLARGISYPINTIKHYKGESKDYKGNIAKIVKEGDKLKFIDSSNSEVTNAILEDVVLVNEDTIVKNNTNVNGYLLSWKRDIFNDGSEVGNLEYKDGYWYDYYTGNKLYRYLSTDEENGTGVTAVGRFGEPAICSMLQSIQYPTEYKNMRGPSIDLNIGITDEVAVSFFYYNKGGDGIGAELSLAYDRNRFMMLMWPVGVNTQKRSIQHGFIPHGNTSSDWNSHYADKKVIIAYNDDRYTSKLATITDALNGGVPFTWYETWHHILFNVTKTTITLYIDGNLIAEYSHASADIDELVTMVLGRYGAASEESYVCGIYSDIRVFNRLILPEEIQTLMEDTPIIEKQVDTIKTMEYDNGLVSLTGGVVYKPVYDVFPYSEVSDTGHVNCVFATSTPECVKVGSNKNFILCKDYVRFFERYSITRAALATRPDEVNTEELGFNLNDMEIYIRIRVRDSFSGYILSIGNPTTSFVFRGYDYNLRVQWRQSNGSGNRNIVISPRTSELKNKWIELKWTQTQLDVYYDGEDLPFFTQTYAASTWDHSKGQIGVGSKRGGNFIETSTYDNYSFGGDISDLIIYKKGTMNTTNPVIYKEYHFGYERDGLAGLNAYSTYNMVPIPNADGTGIAFSGRIDDTGTGSLASLWLNDTIGQVLDAAKGFSLSAYLYIDKQFVNINKQISQVYPFTSSGASGISVNYNHFQSRSYHYCINSRSNSSLYSMWSCNTTVVNRWNHFGYVGYTTDIGRLLRYDMYESGVCIGTRHHYDEYSLIPKVNYSNTVMDVQIVPNFSNNSNKETYNNGFDKINLYDKVLPPSCWRNMAQNYSGRVCSNKMQVAVLTENTSTPIYKGTPITKITIDGNDNGQILSFAVAQGAEDYFIYSDSWKKIVTTEGDNYKYRDGNTWVTANDKFDALEKAMDIQDNRMSLAEINSLTPSQIAEFYDQSIGSIDIAVGMKSDGSISPYIDGITFNNEKVWLSHVYDLSEFSNKNYDTKAYLHKILAEGETDGIKLYSYVSGSDSWKEVPQFGPIPDIIPGTENTGTVQFKVVYDQSKDNKDEPISFNVQIK